MRDIQNVTLPPSRPTGKFNLCHMAWGIEPGCVATTKPRPHPLMIFCTRIWETGQIFVHVENKSADMEKRHDVQARGVWQPSRQQAPHASPAQSGVHASAAAAFPPARQEGD